MRPNESFIAQPVRSLQTMLRVISEDDSSLPTVIPDGIYGADTMQAVAAFQRRMGIPSTGITDQNTWDSIVSAYEIALIRVDKAQPIEIIMDAGEVFKYGDSNGYIYLMQSMLIQLAQDHILITEPLHTGTIDEHTEIALRSFQKLAGLPETGELDKITWKHLVHQFTLNTHHNAAMRRK